ncbi:MAG: hypothetical protein OEM82_10570 [Acidobacteriota bacterium]|nr:hypothetical protein [Acidobacteriota bacterium]MDH3528931.1 hypothetical protein [Acidobacteriota bacterium]
MRTFFRVAVLGLLFFAVVAISNQTAVAQTDTKADLYEKFTANYNGDLEQQKIAVTAGKEFIRLYENSADDKPIIDYLKGAIPSIEASIKAEETRLKEEEKRKALAAERAKLFSAFDAAYKKQDWNTFFATGEKIVEGQPDFYDVDIVMASQGLEQAEKNNNTFNDVTVRRAINAIAKLKSGAEPKTPTCGGSYYVYKSEEYPKCVPNALGWMNYTVGYIKFYRQQKEDEAIPYLFEATKADSGSSEAPQPFRAIASWYVKKAASLIEKRNMILEERNTETKLTEPDAEKIKGFDKRIDEIIALERGYADRAIDAYSRAYSLIPVSDRSKEYASGIFGKLQQLYKLRYYEKPEMQTDTQINMNMSMIKAKTMPDPNTDVQPVFEVKPDVEASPDVTKTTTGTSRSRTVSSRTSN